MSKDFCNLTVAAFLFLGHGWLTADLGGSGGALGLLDEEKRLGPPAVNNVDLPTDGLNDREANGARNGPWQHRSEQR